MDFLKDSKAAHAQGTPTEPEPATTDQQASPTDATTPRNTSQGRDQAEEIVDKGLFTRSDSSNPSHPVLTKAMSNKKAMLREYVPKTIIQFLRERKSFHENSEMLREHMQASFKINSPGGLALRATPLTQAPPELILDPDAKTPADSNTNHNQKPFVVAVIYLLILRLWVEPTRVKPTWWT